MSKMTWLNVGGQADVLVRPRDIEDLTCWIKNTELPFNVIGATSNTIVRDSGIRGITAKIRYLIQIPNLGEVCVKYSPSLNHICTNVKDCCENSGLHNKNSLQYQANKRLLFVDATP